MTRRIHGAAAKPRLGERRIPNPFPKVVDVQKSPFFSREHIILPPFRRTHSRLNSLGGLLSLLDLQRLRNRRENVHVPDA